MTIIVTRSGKGSSLSWAEMDANLNNLNADKLEASALTPYATTAAVNAGLAAKINTSEIGVSVQAYSANLDEYAAVNPTAAGLDLLDDADAAAQRTTLGLVIGTNVQAYDAQTVLSDVPNNFTAPQRSGIFIDNDGSFNLSASQNFKCTTAGAITLTFTNQADGLSGSIILVNTSNRAVSAHANTKISSTSLTRVSATGTYRIDYISDGTNAYCTASENLA